MSNPNIYLTDTNQGKITYNITDQTLSLGNNNIDSLFVDTSGNIGIGTTNPGFTLDVQGNVNLSGTLNQGGSPFVSSLWTESGGELYYNAGNVGIGTDNPGTELEVYDSTGSCSLTITANDANGSFLLFKDVSGNQTSSIYADHAAEALIFRNNTTTERMRIDSGGNVGIGTDNPVNSLHLNGTGGSNHYLHFTTSSTGTTDNDGFRMGLTGSNAVLIGNKENTAMVFHTNDTERLRITNSGLVGIGTNNPSTELHIYDTTNATQLRIENTNTVNGSQLGLYTNGNDWLIGSGGSTNVNTPNGFFVYDDTNTAYRMVINSSGLVGIGTTDPSTKLHVYHSSSAYLRLQNDTTGGTSADGSLIGIENGTSALRIVNRENDYLTLETNDTERMRITSTGRVGINTNAPSTDFHIAANLGAASGSYAAGDRGLLITGTGGRCRTYWEATDATSGQRIFMADNQAGTLRFSSLNDAANGFTTQDFFNLKYDGTVGIGTTNPTLLLDIQGFVNGDQGMRIEQTAGGTAARTVLNVVAPGGTTELLTTTGSYTTSGIYEANASYLTGNLTQGMKIATTNAAATADITFLTNSTERMIIEHGGFVGIGTNNPNSQFQVWSSAEEIAMFRRNDTSSPAVINIENNTSSSSRLRLGYDSSGIVDNSLAAQVIAEGNDLLLSGRTSAASGIRFYTNPATAAVERMRIDSAGSVGIGTNSPDYLLHIQLDQNNNTRFQVRNNTTGTAAQASARIYANSSILDLAAYSNTFTTSGAAVQDGVLIATHNITTGGMSIACYQDDMRFYTGGTGVADTTERMRIANGGNVGIGTNAPDALLTIGSGATADNDVFLKFNTDRPWQFEQTGNDSSAQLVLKTTSSGKFLYIRASDDSPVAAFHANSSGANKVGFSTESFTNNIELAEGSHVINDGGYHAAKTIYRETFPNESLVGDIGTWTSSGNVTFTTDNGGETAAKMDTIGILISPELVDLETYWKYYTVGSFTSGESYTASRIVMKAIIQVTGMDSSSENCFVDFTTDNGSTWINQWRNNNHTAPQGYHPVVVDITNYIVDGVQIKFRFRTSGTGAGDAFFMSHFGVYVDDSASWWNFGANNANFVGNVGVGTTNPSEKLHIENTSGGASTVGMKMTNRSGSNNTEISLDFAVSSLNTTMARIAADRQSNNGHLVFSTHNSSTLNESMRILGSGNVGIGTTGPARELDVHNNQNGNTGMRIFNSNSGTGAYTQLQLSPDSGNGYLRAFSSGFTTAGSNVADSFQLFADDAFANGLNIVSNNNIGFWTGGGDATAATERMIIDSNGQVIINATAATEAALYVVGENTGVRKQPLELYRPTTNTSAFMVSGFSDVTSTNTEHFRILCNGNVLNTNNSYGAISDATLKQQITDANSQWDDIKDLRVVNYKLNNEVENLGNDNAKVRMGLIAQEAELVSPGIVSEGEDGLKSIKYSVLYMKAVKALQEAMDRIEVLEEKLARNNIV